MHATVRDVAVRDWPAEAVGGACGIGRSRATLCAVMVVAAARGHVGAVNSALTAETFNDPENARIILLMAGGLLLLGVLVAVGTFWWWRASRVEHPALGPLEMMGSRSWWRDDYSTRRRRLEASRPTGAEPAGSSASRSSEPVDLEAAALASPSPFDDLVEFPMPVAAEAADLDAVDFDAATANVADAETGGADAVVLGTVEAEPVPDEAPIDDPDDMSVSAKMRRSIDPLMRQHSSE